MKPLIEVQGLCKYFPVRGGLFARKVGEVRAVDDVSFHVGRRETLSLVGESGCGKTTVARTLLRLLRPSAGRALYRPDPDGPTIDLFQLGERRLRHLRRELQIVFQDPLSSLNPRMSVGQIVGEALTVHGLARGTQRDERVEELLERVGLRAEAANRFPHEFSGGQRQRISIARALAVEPRFLVCDEAVSALDVSVQAQIINLLVDLQDELDLSYLFIAHDLSVVKHVSQRVAVMYLGRIVEIGSREHIFEHAAHPYTQALLSAIPVPDPTHERDRTPLQGDVPSPSAQPAGCHFQTRCPLAEERCRATYPSMSEVAPGHSAACHLLQDS